jgi:hypothetical protein
MKLAELIIERLPLQISPVIENMLHAFVGCQQFGCHAVSHGS